MNKKLTKVMGKKAKEICNSNTEVKAVSPDWGVETIEGNLDGQIAAQATIEKIIEQEKNYDSFIIGCYSDPGLYEAREITEKPVFGIAESSMVTALLLGHKFSILSPLKRLKPIIENLVVRYGLDKRCSSIKTVEINVNESFNKRKEIANLYIEQGNEALKEGAEVIILGGAIFSDIRRKVEKELKVPVIEGFSCALKLSEFFTDLGISHSKNALYKYPESKKIFKCSDLIRSIYKQK